MLPRRIAVENLSATLLWGAKPADFSPRFERAEDYLSQPVEKALPSARNRLHGEAVQSNPPFDRLAPVLTVRPLPLLNLLPNGRKPCRMPRADHGQEPGAWVFVHLRLTEPAGAPGSPPRHFLRGARPWKPSAQMRITPIPPVSVLRIWLSGFFA